MINFTETDIKFIKSNIPNYEKIFKSSNLRDVLIVLSDWISKTVGMKVDIIIVV